MSQSNAYELLIGACGWRHPRWGDDFYPADLPEEWWLAYYGNEFRVVLIPWAYWQEPDWVRRCCADSSASLQLVGEIPAGQWIDCGARSRAIDWAALEQALSTVRSLGERLLGVLLSVPDPCSLDHAHLAELLQRAAPAGRICVDLRGVKPDATQRAVLEAAGAGWCWHGETAQREAFYGQLALARVNTQGFGPRALRGVVEHCVQQARAARLTQRYTALLIDGDPPAIAHVRNAGIIAGLL